MEPPVWRDLKYDHGIGGSLVEELRKAATSREWRFPGSTLQYSMMLDCYTYQKSCGGDLIDIESLPSLGRM